MTEQSDPGKQPNHPFRFSLKILMAAFTCVAALFGLYRLLWPLWPRDMHSWTLPCYLGWTTSVVGLGASLFWMKRMRQNRAGISEDDYRLDDHMRRACLWSAIPLLYWCGFTIMLTKPSAYFDWSLYCLAAAHLFPTAFVGCEKTYRALRVDEGRAVVLLWITSTGTALAPVSAAVVYLIYQV